MIDICVEALGVFRALAFDEAVAVDLLVKFDHATRNKKELVRVGRCASDSHGDK